MYDVIEKIGNTTVQHGKYNDRVYLMKLAPQDLPGIVADIEDLAQNQGYGKIIGKIPVSAKSIFLEKDYNVEASIPGFLGGKEDVFFLAKYLVPSREKPEDEDEIKEIRDLALTKKSPGEPSLLPKGFRAKVCSPEDAPEIASVYRTVFASYPFPIYDPDYIVDTMRSHVIYFAILQDDAIVAMSSSEMGVDKNAEMTDFATLPRYRRHGFAGYLLGLMECEMRERAIKTAYTIARSLSAGMNITFAKKGYEYGGTLRNNTNISGKIESMNIWHKQL